MEWFDVSEPCKQIDDRKIIDKIKRWVGGKVIQKMLVENPAKMFM